MFTGLLTDDLAEVMGDRLLSVYAEMLEDDSLGAMMEALDAAGAKYDPASDDDIRRQFRIMLIPEISGFLQNALYDYIKGQLFD